MKKKVEIEILKEKKGTVTKLKYGVYEYALVHPNTSRGGYKQSLKDKAR